MLNYQRVTNATAITIESPVDGTLGPQQLHNKERQPQQAMRLREGTKAAAPRRRRGGGYNMI